MDHINSLIKLIRGNNAFNGIPSNDLRKMIAEAKITEHTDGERILTSRQNLDSLCIVKNGRVALKEDDILLVKIIEGDFFPLGIIESGGTSFLSDCDGIAEGPTTILHVPLIDVQHLREKNGLTKEVSQPKSAKDSTPQKLPRKAPEYVLRQGESLVTLGHITSLRMCPTLEITSSIRDAGRILSVEGAVAIVEGGKYYSMATANDFCRWISNGFSLDTALFQVIQRSDKFLRDDQHKSEAERKLLSWDVDRAVVLNGDRVAGIVTLRDLMDRRSAAGTLSRRIEAAPDLEELMRCGNVIRDLSNSYMREGVDPSRLTKFISGMNDELTQRLIDLEIAKRDMHYNAYSWITMGSEGRMEQSLISDQDNAMIFDYDSAIPKAVARDEMIDLSRSINQGLADCGIPICEGKIMASNPRWCMTLNEWKEQFSEWIHNPTEEALINATIFFDFRHVHGSKILADDLSDWLSIECRTNPKFLQLLTQMALTRTPPINFMKNIATDKDGRFDVKLSGTTIFVDAARIFSLASGIQERSTIERFRAAAQKKIIKEAEAESWVEAFIELQNIRLMGQNSKSGLMDNDNKINVNDLPPLLSKRLLEALKAAKFMQTNLNKKYL